MQHCPECGFANAEGANYCQRCGAFMGGSESAIGESTTASFKVDDSSALDELSVDRAGRRGAMIVIRAGGGRAGEAFALDHPRLSVGRRPDSDIFLDDITVSRDHAVIVKRGEQYFIDDCGSLNGTYVNRRRIDSQALSDGDELQIGKYKLAFLGY
ncbi:MAG: FHA domain-containing protein [Solirubrobacteraceae bacterium]